MKRTLSLLIALTIACSVFLLSLFNVGAQSSDAQPVYETCGDFNYTILADGTARIEGYQGTETEIDVPSSLNEYKVTSLGEFAFFNCESLETVTIPKGVTDICISAFHNCEKLSKIIVDSENEVYDSRENCNAIIESKTNTLVSGCVNTVIPASVTSIGDSAFTGCNGLLTIAIPDSVKSIGGAAFFYCQNLTSITISKGVESIGTGVFHGCESLAEIKVDSGNKVYDSRNNCNAVIESKTNTLLFGCMNTVIPDGVTDIAKEAFWCCYELKSITIPKSVTSIGESAFSCCENLTSVTIEQGVKKIGDAAFYKCDNLKSVTIPKSVKTIGEDAFYNDDGNLCLYVCEHSYAHRYAKSNYISYKLTASDGGFDFGVAGILLCIAIALILVVAVLCVITLKKRKNKTSP